MWRDGVRAGEYGSASGLAKVLEQRGRVDEAVALLRPSALKGDADPLLTLTLLLGRHGRDAEDERLLETVSTTYDKGTGWLVSLLLKQERSDEAQTILLRSALNGGEEAWTSRRRLVELLVERGRIDEAEELLRKIAASGNLAVNEELVTFLETHRHTDESEQIWRRLADPRRLDHALVRRSPPDQAARTDGPHRRDRRTVAPEPCHGRRYTGSGRARRPARRAGPLPRGRPPAQRGPEPGRVSSRDQSAGFAFVAGSGPVDLRREYN
ncbi:tetratricopeptide repeat protein [Streptomyces europaeiscabiei]|nr:tetratricopeptide repeat protein [Streptomyces europaeiscabiei]WSG29039.1 tetratricopeptide repeat protein [Streptomyces europaeiscabiei]